MSSEVFLARQAIVDRDHRTFGYELLYRDDPAGPPRLDDPDLATQSLLSRAVLDFGLAQLIGERFGFVNATPRFVLDGLHRVLPPDGIVIEIRAPQRCEPPEVAAIEEARADGYHFALDNVTDTATLAASPLFDLVSIVKIEVSSVEASEVAAIACWVRERRPEVLLAAEKVETSHQYSRARRAGFDLFEGYFFERPEVLTSQRHLLDAEAAVRLITDISASGTDSERLGQLIESDPLLSFSLLAVANSRVYGASRRVESVRHAIVLMGTAAARQLAAVLAMAQAGAGRGERVVAGAVRARVMSALVADPEQRPAAFAVGLLSVVDSAVGLPLSALPVTASLPQEVESALVGGSGPLGELLSLALASEHADLEDLVRLAPGRVDEVQDAYRAGAQWADQALRHAGIGLSSVELAST